MTALRGPVPTILVVEDNGITRKMVRVTLEAEGYAVLEAPDGRTALSLLGHGQPDLVIQDFRLPDIDAFELLARIRASPGGDKLPVLAFSGYQSKLEEARASAIGFDDYLLKPVEPSRLVTAVQAYTTRQVAGAPAPGQGRCVLVVDDDPIQLKLARVMLRGLGFRVEVAPGADEALARLRELDADAIVTDTMMPRTDGFRFCLAVRRDPRLRDVPVVMVSSVYLDEQDREFARKVGANAFVLRTPNFREVIDALLASLQGRSPPPSGDIGPELKEEYTHRVIQQLERQVAKNADLAQRASLQATALSILGAVSDAMSRPLDVDGALQDVLSQCLDAAGISRGALYRLEAGGRLALGARTGYGAEAKPLLESFFGQLELAHRVVAAGTPVSLPSSSFDRAEQTALLDRAEAKSALLIPLLAYGDRVGLFFLASEVTDLAAEHWTPFAHTMAVQIGQALALARAFGRVVSSEQRYRALVDSAGEAILVTDGEDVVLEANRQAEVLFGASAAALAGRPAPDFLSPEQRDRAGPIRAALARHGSTRATDLVVQRPDGSKVPVDLSVVELRLDTGTIRMAVVRDLTEQKRLQAQLMVSDRMASVGMLAAGVAHEINNPLAAVMANLDLALRDAGELAKRLGPAGGLEELLEELRDARDASERVRQTVRDLRIFSRSEEDRRGAIDVRRVLESSLRMAWNEIRHRARLVKSFDVVPMVEANESRLGQVFLNLIVNAAHAIPEGRAESNEIRVSTRLDGAGRVLVEIADTGSGMSAEVLGKLFTPFFTTKPPGVGTGLGLTICHRLVTAIGGEISVESRVGEGTTFRIALRQAKADDLEDEASPPAARAPARRGRVLAVDDEKLVGRTIRRTLADEHDVIDVAHAADALARIAGGERFDVILCDLMMPEMTGMDLHAELTRVAPDQAARMIFLTGGAFTPRARAFLDALPNLRIEKPFEIQNLRALVNERVR